MSNDRGTVSPDEGPGKALDGPTDATGQGQSELARRSLPFDPATSGPAHADAIEQMEWSLEMRSGSEQGTVEVDPQCRFSNFEENADVASDVAIVEVRDGASVDSVTIAPGDPVRGG